MRKRSIQQVYSRIKGLLFDPEKEWKAVGQEKCERGKLFRRFMIYPCALLSLLTALLRLFYNTLLVAVEYGLINFISCTAGAYITWWVTSEYLAEKMADHRNHALNLSVYCCLVYMIFRSLSLGFASSFMGNLMDVLGLISVYILYVGLNTLTGLSSTHKKSALIISGLLIVCTPPILTRLLTILLRIPAFNA